MFILHFTVLSVKCVPIVLQLIVKMFSISMSGMSKKLAHFLELQRNYNFYVCYYVLLFLYTCLTVLLMFSCMFLVHLFFFFLYILVAANCSFVVLGSNFLHISNDIMFPSL